MRNAAKTSRGDLQDGCTELDARGLRCEVGERRHGIGAIGFGGPDGVIAHGLCPEYQFDRDVEAGSGVADVDAEFHVVSSR